jgi:hypothetical protein
MKQRQAYRFADLANVKTFYFSIKCLFGTTTVLPLAPMAALQ